MKSPEVQATPLEDFTPTTVLHTRQLEPNDISFTLQDVYDWAYLGLSLRGCAAKVMLSENTFAFHFGKTVAKAKADRAMDLYALIGDNINECDYSAKRRPDIDSAWKLLNRVDPQPKEPAVVIAQNFSASPAVNWSIDAINAELLENPND